MKDNDDSTKTQDSWEGEFYFHPGDAIYREHFPGYPVVPGSLIVHAFLMACRSTGIAAGIASLENFKFRKFLSPGRYSFKIKSGEEGFYCSISEGKKKLVTGVINR